MHTLVPPKDSSPALAYDRARNPTLHGRSHST